jgi:uncharacterized protein (DUF1330 family)
MDKKYSSFSKKFESKEHFSISAQFTIKKEISMTTYMIIYDNVSDMNRFRKYAEAAEPLIKKFGGNVTTAGIPEVLEGDFPWERVFLFEWKSKAEALNFWHSSEYTEVKKLREGIAEFQAIVIEGVSLPQFIN